MAIDLILGDFRTWLESLAEVPAMAESVPAFDLATVVAQFTALRHDVNLQTKAARAITEQTAKVLESVNLVEADDKLKPTIKSLLDVTDALTVSFTQIQKLRETVEPLLEDLAVEPLPDAPMVPTAKPGFLAKLFGATDTSAITTWIDDVHVRDEARRESAADASDTLLTALTSAVDGYAMSLRRVERALPEFGLDAIDVLGKAFDADTMEVVELGGDGNPGTVTREVRRGYTWKGRVFRCAQVCIAGSR